jgi:hypothetical protein
MLTCASNTFVRAMAHERATPPGASKTGMGNCRRSSTYPAAGRPKQPPRWTKACSEMGKNVFFFFYIRVPGSCRSAPASEVAVMRENSGQGLGCQTFLGRIGLLHLDHRLQRGSPGGEASWFTQYPPPISLSHRG